MYTNYAATANNSPQDVRASYNRFHALRVLEQARSFSTEKGAALVDLLAKQNHGGLIETVKTRRLFVLRGPSFYRLSKPGEEYLTATREGLRATREALKDVAIEDISATIDDPEEYVLLRTTLAMLRPNSLRLGWFTAEKNIGSYWARTFKRLGAEMRVLDRSKDAKALADAFPNQEQYTEAITFYDLILENTIARPSRDSTRVFTPADVPSLRSTVAGRALRDEDIGPSDDGVSLSSIATILAVDALSREITGGNEPAAESAPKPFEFGGGGQFSGGGASRSFGDGLQETAETPIQPDVEPSKVESESAQDVSEADAAPDVDSDPSSSE